MKRGNRGWGIVVVGTVLALAALTGCQVIPRNVIVERSPALQERTVQVALVGLADFQVDEWKTINLLEFWKPGNARRENARNDGYLRVWVFKAGTDPSQNVLKKTDPIWTSGRAGTGTRCGSC